MALFESTYEIKIPFYDLDMMGIVWHGNYVKYMEEARCDLFSKLNYTYMDMKADGIAYPVAKMETKFIGSAYFDKVIIVKTSLVEIEPGLRMKYEIFDKETSKKLFSASTLQIAVDINTRQTLYEAPIGLKDALKKTNEAK